MNNRKELAEMYKRRLSDDLACISLDDNTKMELMSHVTHAIDDLTPTEHIEDTEVKEDNVVCKMLLKGYPQHLLSTLQAILNSLYTKNRNNDIDLERTGQYTLTLLIEKAKKT